MSGSPFAPDPPASPEVNGNSGSLPPEFESDQADYFLVRLPVQKRAKQNARRTEAQATPQVTPQVPGMYRVCTGYVPGK